MDTGSETRTFEKTAVILDAEILVELSNLGVQLVGGEARIAVSLLVPQAVEKRVQRLLAREGFEPVARGPGSSGAGLEEDGGGAP